MLKIIRSFFVVVALASISQAAQPWATGGASSIYEVGASTPALTAVLISAGAGAFNSAEISSSTVGAYCTFVDSASVSGITAANMDGTNTAPVLARVWFITANTPQRTTAPYPFRNGLVAICTHLARLIVFGSRN